MKIKNIKETFYKGKVYDLTIKENHNYIINGVVVHNCHEQSNKKGQHGNLVKLLEILNPLPGGVELALGGGSTTSHPMLSDFLYNCKQNDWICNITVNQLHIKRDFKLISDLIRNDLIKGIGISLRKAENVSNEMRWLASYEHSVIHLIAGINNYDDIEKLMELGFKKFLILGYKQFGNGIEHYEKFGTDIKENINKWYMYMPKYVGKCVLSFDNLAIEQLNVKRLFTADGWNRFYQGDDFTESGSMYVDAVKQEYAHTSRSKERTSFNDCSLIEYFKHK